MYTKLVTAIVLCGLFIHVYSQPVKPLHIGDILTNRIFTYPAPEAWLVILLYLTQFHHY
ncbi:MAG: hypothetical protein KF746_24265 [Chitinophagaceae bacterium]|nr:hypothetical protein [Chitinophagaceae bacterium]